jgi:hypothetical protein
VVRPSRARVLGLAWLLASATASAQSTDDARYTLIVQASEARDAGDDRRALELARRADALRSTPSLHLLLAQLEERLAEPVAALDDARRCEAELEADRAHRDWQRYFDSCHALVTALEGRIGRITVEVPEVPGVEVTLNQRPLARTDWGVAREVVPGYFVVEARASEGRRFHVGFDVFAGGAETVRVVFETRPPAVTVVAPPRVAPVAVAGLERRSAGPGPWAVMGVGTASLVASGVFFTLRAAALSDRDAACGTPAGDCTPATDVALAAATSAQRDAHTFNALFNVTLGVGSAAVVGGALWWALGRSTRAPAVRHTVVVTPRGDGAMVTVGGAM